MHGQDYCAIVQLASLQFYSKRIKGDPPALSTAQIIQQTYDRCSGFYDWFFEPWLECGRIKALDRLKLSPGDTLLEVGIGTGLGLEHYPTGINLIGFDYSHGMLKQSRIKADTNCPCENVDLFQMDVQKMAFPDNSFDRILAAYVLTVVPDIEKAMHEILRVARPGAMIVIINHLPSSNNFLAELERIFHPVFSTIGLFALNRDILELLHSLGITEIQIEPANFLAMHYVISFKVPLNLNNLRG